VFARAPERIRVANEDQRKYWNEQAGPTWVSQQERLDPQIRPHGARGLALLDARAGERVLDVGCGCGETSLELARRVGPSGRVLGADISGPMLDRARERATAAGLANLSFVQADAQTHGFEPASFDALFSRFGVMFFEDPPAAFTNLAKALRSGGRVAFVCWQPIAANPWLGVPMAALAPLLPPLPPLPEGAPGPFAFGDPARVEKILASAGFVEISLRGEHVPMGFPTVEEGARFLVEMGPVGAALRQTGDAGLKERALSTLREVLRPHAPDGSPRLGSAIWLASARKPH
jgi:SAM-dependent methyltransferase